MAHLQHYYFEYFAVVGHELVYNSVCEHVMCHMQHVREHGEEVARVEEL